MHERYSDKLATAQAAAGTAEEALRAKIQAEADAIMELCSAAGCPELAADAFAAHLTLDQVKEAIAIRKAAQDRETAAASLSAVWSKWNATGHKPPAAAAEGVPETTEMPKTFDDITASAYARWNNPPKAKAAPQS